MNVFSIFVDLIVYGIFLYSVVLLLSYIFIGIFSVFETRLYLNKNSLTDYRLLASSPHAPTVSILAPAYNEGATIIENVKSLLSLYYSNLEVIIINDGSKDDTLAKLIDAYDLEKINHHVQYLIQTKEIRGIYKSKASVYNKLVVVDKVNGGKADALNVGVNVSCNDYIFCIDVDCILEQDSVLKMIKPFTEQTEARVIASGGVVRIANSCEVVGGRLVKVHLPKNYWARMQSLEYIRAFILGRMAWARLNGLLLISGAFGTFDKEIVIKCGGYDHNTVGEDMELVVRMRRYMEEEKLPYKVTYIPDPLCWTEAPENKKILGRQRNRWTRGTIETLKFHKKMFFNPKYGILGMLSYPYWFFFEMLAPPIEFIGFITFVFLAVLGLISWNMFFALFLFIITFGYMYSAFAAFMEVASYNMYRRRSEMAKLILTAFTEPFYFHPFGVWSAIKGYKDLIMKNKSWGEMTRVGFANTSSPTTINPAQHVNSTINNLNTSLSPISFSERLHATEDTQILKKAFAIIKTRVDNLIKQFAVFFIITIILEFLVRLFEFVRNFMLHGLPEFYNKVVSQLILKDLLFDLNIGLLFLAVFILFSAINKQFGKFLTATLASLVVFIHLMLTQYFLKTLVPLGADLWGYSIADIKQTVGASGGVSQIDRLAMFFLLIILITSYAYFWKRIKVSSRLSYIICLLLLISFIPPLSNYIKDLNPGQEYSANLASNKESYFYSTTWEHFFPPPTQNNTAISLMSDSSNNNPETDFKYIDEKNYPFAHLVDSNKDVLTPFFAKDSAKPNFVIMIVEGLGRAFTNESAYLGNFTPFIDSLSKKSLYWKNFLSEGGRTFAVLPSLIGSAPFGRNGFNELGDKMPPGLSLINVLKGNGYNTSFFYGGDSHFDNMDIYMKKNKVDNIYDLSNFPTDYTKMPSTAAGFTWGYGDKELFRRVLSLSRPQPYATVVLTLSTHDPFAINDQQSYFNKFEKRLNQLGFNELQKSQARNYKAQYASILFMNDAVENFINEYKKLPQFKNTVFIITGDHRMPEIPMSTKLDRYHVPLLIYSPLLQRPTIFNSISTHFDITPSILGWLKNSYHLKVPSVAAWMGSGLDTSISFRNIHSYPLMQTKTNISDFVKGEYILNENNLFKIMPNMDLEVSTDKVKLNDLKNAFNVFKSKNELFINGAGLLPDSVLLKFNRNN